MDVSSEVSLASPEGKQKAPGMFTQLAKSMSEIEIQSKFVNNLRICILGAVIVISGTGIPEVSEKNVSFMSAVFFKILGALSLSHDVFGNDTIYALAAFYLAVGAVLLVIMVALGLRYRYRALVPARAELVAYIVVVRLVIPVMSLGFGKAFGYCFYRYSVGGDLEEINSCTGMTGYGIVLWFWVVTVSSYLYNWRPLHKPHDSSQVRFSEREFEMYITILPGVLPAARMACKCFVRDALASGICIFLCALIVIGSCVYLKGHVPYMNLRTNALFRAFFVSMLGSSVLGFLVDLAPKWAGVWLVMAVFFNVMCFIVNYFLYVGMEPTDPEESGMLVREDDNFTQIAEDSSKDVHYSIFSCQTQDLVVVVYFTASVFTMVLMNALAAQRMPDTAPLPDVFHESFAIAQQMRSSPTFGSMQYPNILCLVLAVSLISSAIFIPGALNVRKGLSVYGTLCFVRCLAFVVTSLPPPCGGLAKCPCADPESIKALRAANPVVIAMSWLFGVGIFLTYPQCGDLIVSGHTMSIWLATCMMGEVVDVQIPPPFSGLVNVTMQAMSFVAMIYIIIVRNHYTIDVWFGWLLPHAFYVIYSLAQHQARKPPQPDDLLSVRFVRWLESRPIPLKTKFGPEAIVSDPEQDIEPDLEDVAH